MVVRGQSWSSLHAIREWSASTRCSVSVLSAQLYAWQRFDQHQLRHSPSNVQLKSPLKKFLGESYIYFMRA